MKTYLILKLQGAMQAWGGHTYEDFRSSHPFPTRSGIVGLLAGCFGIDRENIEKKEALNNSFVLTVRADKKDHSAVRITDYHTVLSARKVDGNARKDAIQSYREYLCDAQFTLALEFLPDAEFPLDEVVRGLMKPVYTPVLGRRACPLHRPLFEAKVEASDVQDALNQVRPFSGTIYSEMSVSGGSQMSVRDVPMPTAIRQFATRTIYVHGGSHVSE